MIDAAQRQTEFVISFFEQLKQFDSKMFESDENAEMNHIKNDEISFEVIMTAAHDVLLKWQKKYFNFSVKLNVSLTFNICLFEFRIEKIFNFDVLHNLSTLISNLKMLFQATLSNWTAVLKIYNFSNAEITNQIYENINDEKLQIQRILTFELINLATSNELKNWQKLRHQLNNDATSLSVLNLIKDRLFLNHKQKIIIEKIVTNVMKWQHFSYDNAKREQLLLYVENENEVDKSQIIREICADLTLLNREHEMMLMNSTNVSIFNIDDSIYYTALDIFISDQQNKNISSKIIAFWKKKS